MDQKYQNEPDTETDKLANRVIGCAIEVHRQLGPGFPESVYQEALCQELCLLGIQYSKEETVKIFYKGILVGHGRLDLMIQNKLIVELKAVNELAQIHHYQVKSYLKATGLQLGLLINFNVIRLSTGIKRIIYSS